MSNPMQFDFENKLTELGLSYSIHHLGFYTIPSEQDATNPITVRLIQSLPINEQVHGSKNGNDIEAIGLFKFKSLLSGVEPEILVFAFPNPVKNQAEFVIIPTLEFWRRRPKMKPPSVRRKDVEMVFWLMEDGFVYDATNISPEGEWFFLSKGVSGRMADESEIDYSEYMNSWRRLIV